MPSLTMSSLLAAACATIALTMGAGIALVPDGATAQGGASTAPRWTVDAAQSSIGWSTRWAGSNVTGSFGSWTADIRFDPARPETGQVAVVVQTGSSRSSTGEANDNLPLPDWFNVRAHPTARWDSTAIRANGAGRYIADGTLTLKGQRYRLAIPFGLTVSGQTATMTANLSLDRIALRIGVDSDASAEWVDRNVAVTIRVRATRR